mmetsp:Transcript_16568/g.25734  ORF Transcript_16568/g.25734 Transcript_16568/m.25734 type:complete len:250 (+) Transcript_16568:187-936(+)
MKYTATDDVISEQKTISVYDVACCKQEEKGGEEEPIVQNEPLVDRRAVRFADYPIWHEVYHFNDMTDEEMANTWYTHEEYQKIRASYHDIVRRMTSFDPRIDNEIESTRGLEHKTKEGSRRRKANKIGAIDAVLQEQDRQLLNGTRSTLAIASVYIREAQRAKESAKVKGVADADAVHGKCNKFTTTREGSTSVKIFEDTAITNQRQIRAKNKISSFFNRRKGILVDIKNMNTTPRRGSWSFENIVYLR